ncbi:ABC transporter permease [Methylocystis sp. FS]|uniref:ABC transporter permease n=1 Tax=Methylocystis silviterrae TaxID=2743612 RepID=UPI001584199A|nr:ABC transporter permease [Methylocystis silviterrae]NUJ81791.1 ABC transporter permease [Methylocystis silviterrae]
MDSLDLELVTDEIIPRSGDSTTSSPESTHLPAQVGDGATAALGLVSEAAAAIRELERESAQAITRARNAVKEELERAERAEEMLRLAEAQVEQMMAAAEQSDKDLEILRSELATKTAELAASTRRADDAEVAMQKIVDAIRTQLPVKLSIAAE